MNITILSLISSSVISNSPLFVNNRMFLNACSFQRINSLLFLNQKKLFLKSSSFSKILGGIVLKDNEIIDEGNHISVSNELFQQTYRPNVNKNVSITINDCTFTNIRPNAISVDNTKISIYITSCIFNSCTTNEGIIFLRRSRCLTITHTCCFNSYSEGQNSFLYYDCIETDFTLCLYNTIASSKTSGANGKYNVVCKSGDQYYRCNNMTTSQSYGYQFDAPYCFSFSMMTVVDCDLSCISLTGYKSDQCSIAFDKVIENVNLFTKSVENSPVITISGACDYSITIKNSVLLSQQNLFVKYEGEGKVNLTIINCVVNFNLNRNDATFIDTREANYNLDQVALYPHYTNDVCKGPKLEKPLSAYGCNVGNCIDSICNRTIGFPEGVIPYTTIPHEDINEPTPTPTTVFTSSKSFSPSDAFTSSSKFTSSMMFSQSQNFSESSFFGGDGGNLGGGKDKGISGAKIGIIAGAVGAVVAVVIVVAAFFIIRKRKMMPTSDINMMDTDGSRITQDNDLERVMKEDDPFKQDF